MACTAPGANALASDTPAAPQVIVVTATTVPATSAPPGAPSATISAPTSAPAPTLPPATPPSFSHTINFAETADVSKATRSFHQGTTTIYALWAYSNMTDGLIFRRDWYRDGTLWKTKEDVWSLAKYGANGTVTFISIYDMQKGLPNGHYELKLYINNQPQFSTSDDPALRSFDIVAGAD
jgi:hypothetical protein